MEGGTENQPWECRKWTRMVPTAGTTQDGSCFSQLSPVSITLQASLNCIENGHHANVQQET